MDVVDSFVKTSALICEPARSKILWVLLDGRAYTATELAVFADISLTAASNHLAKLTANNLLKVEVQGRHRYFTIANENVAYAIEALAQVANAKPIISSIAFTGIRYCRTCYDHLAGYVGVQLTIAMLDRGFITKMQKEYQVTKKGWNWLKDFEMYETDYQKISRKLARQCLDWSERKPHLAGQLGKDLLAYMIKNNWFRKISYSRELAITTKGKEEIYKRFGYVL